MKLCLQCGKQFEAAPEDTRPVCAECAAAETPPPIAEKSAPHVVRPPVTLGLIGINCAIFVAMVLAGVSAIDPTGAEVLPWGANFGPLTLGGAWWRAFTCMFLHFGLVHLFMNMWCLLDLGRMAERAFGRWPFLAMYLISGLGGSAVSLRWNPEVVSAGASGAVFGIAGSLVAALYGRKLQLGGESQKRLTSVATFVGYNVLLGLTNSGIDNAAHIGGLAVGFVLGYLIPFATAESQPGDLRPKSGVVFAGVGLAVVGLFWAAHNAHGSVVQVEEARALISAERHDPAIAILREVTKENPQNGEAHLLLGFALMRKEENAAALEELGRAIAERPEDAAAHFYIGLIHTDEERYDEAITFLGKAGQLDPTFWEAHRSRGFAHHMKKEYTQAISAYQKALRLQPSDGWTHYSLGLAFLDSEQLDSAISSFKRAVELRPEDLSGYQGLVSAFSRKGMKKEEAEAQARVKALLERQSGPQ